MRENIDVSTQLQQLFTQMKRHGISIAVTDHRDMRSHGHVPACGIQLRAVDVLKRMFQAFRIPEQMVGKQIIAANISHGFRSAWTVDTAHVASEFTRIRIAELAVQAAERRLRDAAQLRQLHGIADQHVG